MQRLSALRVHAMNIDQRPHKKTRHACLRRQWREPERKRWKAVLPAHVKPPQATRPVHLYANRNAQAKKNRRYRICMYLKTGQHCDDKRCQKDAAKGLRRYPDRFVFHCGRYS
jgi:hypothetical protein